MSERVGSAVFLKWGAVEVQGAGDGRKVYWTRLPQEKTVRCGTAQRAQDYAKAAIARRRNHRYEPLAGPIANRRRSAGGSADLKQTLATILIVDIVGSTEKGRQARRCALDKNHGPLLRGRPQGAEDVARQGSHDDGRRRVGDVQGAAAAGVSCATAIQKAVRTLGLEIRVGLHAGEYTVSGGEMVGLAFHIGTRVAAKARAGEVLVSSAVKELMSKSDIRFRDHGVHQLKGVPERWRLYRVEH